MGQDSRRIFTVIVDFYGISGSYISVSLQNLSKSVCTIKQKNQRRTLKRTAPLSIASIRTVTSRLMENARQKPAAPSRAGRTEAAIPDSIEDENELDDNNMNEEEEDTNFVDNDGDDSDQEDPVAEGDEAPAQAPFQPSYEKANSLRFFDVCKRLEYLWRVRRHGKKLKTKPTTVSQLKAILPPQLLAHLANSNSDNSGLLQSSMSPQSIFPLFRLLMPEKDSSRSFLMKETELAKAYAAAFNLPPTSLQKLLHYGDPHIITNSANVGDFSVVLQEILKGRLVYDTTGKTGSDWTVGHINAVLDDLAGLSQKTRAAKDAYFEQKAKEQQQATTAVPRPRTLSQNRAEWVRSLHKPPPGGKKPLTPLEHKWLVRIVQGQMQFGLTWKTLVSSDVVLLLCAFGYQTLCFLTMRGFFGLDGVIAELVQCARGFFV